MVQVYYFLHILGIILLFSSYGMLIARATLAPDNTQLRKMGAIVSGVALFVILLGGFGLLARIYDNVWHGWAIAKVVGWVLIGGMLALINRKPQLSMVWFWVVIGLGAFNIAMAYWKPFHGV